MKINNDIENANEETRQAWDANAAYWDEKMAEGNDFVNLLQWPAILRLLDPQPGQHILDIATGNGLTARRLAALGAQVTAFDFSEELIKLAQARTASGLHIKYYVFRNGFVLDGFEERAFPPGHPQTNPLGWGGLFSEIPPVLVARLRLLPNL